MLMIARVMARANISLERLSKSMSFHWRLFSKTMPWTSREAARIKTTIQDCCAMVVKVAINTANSSRRLGEVSSPLLLSQL